MVSTCEHGKHNPIWRHHYSPKYMRSCWKVVLQFKYGSSGMLFLFNYEKPDADLSTISTFKLVIHCGCFIGQAQYVFSIFRQKESVKHKTSVKLFNKQPKHKPSSKNSAVSEFQPCSVLWYLLVKVFFWVNYDATDLLQKLKFIFSCIHWPGRRQEIIKSW